jgi:enolase
MPEIVSVIAREILDSRGNPTIEVDVISNSGAVGRAAVPSGASTGAHEAHELRDGDKNRYLGKGVTKAVQFVNEEIQPKLLGMDCTQQKVIDGYLLELDGTKNKSHFGANSILGVSLACARAGADVSGLPLYHYVGGTRAVRLPVPLMNVLNGGAHADNGLDVQEFMIVPMQDQGFRETLRIGAEIFHTLKKILGSKGLATAVGDEGGFAPKLKSNSEALELLMEATEKAGYKPGENVFFALDVAATELFEGGKYKWEGNMISAGDLANQYGQWAKKYPLVSIEDGFAEDDWTAWRGFTESHGNSLQIVGDDLFVTNEERIRKGVAQNAANALLVKVNQIGTLSETWDAVSYAQRNRYNTVMSHRSGETEDTTIADLAVAMGCQQIKTGSLCRSERIAKYNQLLRIEEELGPAAEIWGKEIFRK